MAALTVPGATARLSTQRFCAETAPRNARLVLLSPNTRAGSLKAHIPALLARRPCAAPGGRAAALATRASALPVDDWSRAARLSRQEHLEVQALDALQKTIDGFERPAFPCALIAGDVVILHLLHRLGALSGSDPKVKVVFIDTFHLFPETYEFLKQLEEAYGFQAEVFHATGLANKQEYVEKHGSDLFIVDIDEYDRICKVEPFNRALTSLQVDAMINGRRRDHGAERAHIEVFEAGDPVKVQPLAYWEFSDCFDYLSRHGVPAHPLHSSGFPSVGDVQTTLPVPKQKWFEYGGERSGRFQGLKNRDGSDKTECGIHVDDAPVSSLNPPSSSLTPPSSSLTLPSSSLTPPSSSIAGPSSSLRPPS